MYTYCFVTFCFCNLSWMISFAHVALVMLSLQKIHNSSLWSPSFPSYPFLGVFLSWAQEWQKRPNWYSSKLFIYAFLIYVNKAVCLRKMLVFKKDLITLKKHYWYKTVVRNCLFRRCPYKLFQLLEGYKHRLLH